MREEMEVAKLMSRKQIPGEGKGLLSWREEKLTKITMAAPRIRNKSQGVKNT